MIYRGNGSVSIDKNEPVFRSCWVCNQAHEYLKDKNWLGWCFSCGRYFIFGKFLDEIKSDKEFDSFFQSKGLQPGDSTQSIEMKL